MSSFPKEKPASHISNPPMASISAVHTQPHPDALRASTHPLQGRVFAARRAGYFLPYGFGVVWLCMPANGEGAGALLSLLLRLWPFAMASSGVGDSSAIGAT